MSEKKNEDNPINTPKKAPIPEEKPFIVFTQYSPYNVVNLPYLTGATGKKIPLDPVTSLCRCGGSKSKPFCDGTHATIGFVGKKSKDRVPDQVKEYRGEKINILDNRGVCSHDGTCIRELPQVFRLYQRPWIFPDGAKVADLIKIVKKCPSGALSYKIEDKTFQNFKRSPGIQVIPGGPLEVTGEIKIYDDLNNQPAAAEHYTLCRCGKSKNLPYCDGSHYHHSFDEIPKEKKGDIEKNSAPIHDA